MNPSILYWKWDDSHLNGSYREKIDDIVNRSCFSHIYITTHWCHSGISTDVMKNAVFDACRYIHEKGIKMIFEIDARAEKSVFSKRYPDDRLGFTYLTEKKMKDVTDIIDVFQIHSAGQGELFLGDRQDGEELICAFTYRKNEKGNIIKKSIKRADNKVLLQRKNERNVALLLDQNVSGEYIFAAFVAWLDFPDYFSQKRREFLEELFEKYKNIPLDGLAVDELGLPWHPDFNFSPSTYEVWDRSPVFSKALKTEYQKCYGRDYTLDLLTRFGDSYESSERAAAINRYFEIIRKSISSEENYFYEKAKEMYGENTFVGVHNTWYAIEEVQNTPEVWKTGITWWESIKDFGFTDEIMLYPVRLALAHKAKSDIFYNMWYGEATGDLDTFYTEMYQNLRYGGRTISLSYECINEKGIVEQLIEDGKLEKVNQIEELSIELDKHQKASAKSDILLVMGVESSCNFLSNKNGNNHWDSYRGKLKESFTFARDLWNYGYNCDLVGSYEIYDGNITYKNNKLMYGNEEYKAVIFLYPQYSKAPLFDLISKLEKDGYPVAVIGGVSHDFDGKGIEVTVKNHFITRPCTIDLSAFIQNSNAHKNRIENGCVFRDGSIILTPPAPIKPRGNKAKSTFLYKGISYHVEFADLLYLKLDENGIVESYSPEKFILEQTNN